MTNLVCTIIEKSLIACFSAVVEPLSRLTVFLFTTALIVCELVAAEAVVNDIVANDDNVITDNAIAIILLLIVPVCFFIIIPPFSYLSCFGLFVFLRSFCLFLIL